MKIFSVNFEPVWAVPSGCIIAAKNKEEALEIAKKTISHRVVTEKDIEEVDIKKPCVIFYESGEY